MSSQEWNVAPTKGNKAAGVLPRQENCNSQKRIQDKKRSTHGFSRGWSKPSPSTQTQPNIDHGIHLDQTVCRQTPSEFQAKCKEPLANLLDDYGEQDKNYDKIKVTPSQDRTAGMLSSRGKGPIRIKILSFGFIYNAPKQIREGFGHSNPLPVVDCRVFPKVPPYMERFNGLSYQVKRTIIQSCNNGDCAVSDDDDDDSDMVESPINQTLETNSIRRQVQSTCQQVLQAILDAISTGGYGYAFPLEATIYVGSEFGRHRSVVYSELLAQHLRTSLRLNPEGKVTQPVSVETAHRDMERRSKSDEPSGRKKMDKLETEW